MKAADIMRYRVVTVSGDPIFQEAARLVLDHGIRSLPVADHSGSVIGL
jgi:CBS-domain-containing membrane protein